MERDNVAIMETAADKPLMRGPAWAGWRPDRYGTHIISGYLV